MGTTGTTANQEGPLNNTRPGPGLPVISVVCMYLHEPRPCMATDLGRVLGEEAKGIPVADRRLGSNLRLKGHLHRR